MPLLIDCPSGHRLEVPLKRAGHLVRCPVCDQSVEIPPLPARKAVTPPPDRPPQARIQVGRHRLAKPPATPEAQATLNLRIDTSSSFARDKLRATIEQAESRRDRERTWTAFGLGIVALGLAALCATPSFMDPAASWHGTVLSPADAWTYLVLLMALIQAAVAVYAMRLPDWSTSWVVSLVATAAAAMYALGLALTMFADQENQIVRQLGLLDEAFRGTAQRWCFLVMCVTLILAYCYGRFSWCWYREDQRLRETRV